MRDLRVIGSDEGSIILESIEGDRFRLVVDEHVKSSVRSASSSHSNRSSVTPREIQDRIRAGESVSQIVESSGVDEDYINKFAQPVLDELEHIIASALAIRITIAGDRFNDPNQEEFGNLITSRLTANGATDLIWSSHRNEGGVWALTAKFNMNGGEGEAVWSYEPRRFVISPENDSAVTLSNHSSPLDGVLPKLRTIPGAHPATGGPTKKESAAPSEVSSSPVVSDGQNKNSSAPAAFRKAEAETTPQEAGPAASTTDLLDELQKRRKASEAKIVEPIETESQIEEVEDFDLSPEDDVYIELVVEEIEPELVEDDDSESQIQSEPLAPENPDETNAQPKRGRTAMPSWDEIVFGTKADE